MKNNKVAVFDVDGTLTSKDTFLEFLKFVKGKNFFIWCLIANSPYIILYYLKLIPNYRLKEYFFSFYFKNEPEEGVLKLGREFALSQFPNLIYRAASQVLNWHRQNGHEVVFLTASSPIWLGPWCSEQGIHIAGTDFEVSNGRYTGKILGKNCYGREKIPRLTTILNSLNIHEVEYAYGDSPADQYFLKLAKYSIPFPLTKKIVTEKINYVLS
ncbi:HAD-IB family hydrolase [Algoriphagus vanfongensis]|uniref:HAD-IB family hydrolase n=1 Tax=Algoriphagus vanfongensis TaxID=426371 RepID=UPI000687B5DA|nr:HAD-IB family hydrolase [Algoriphagus vanfongensis]